MALQHLRSSTANKRPLPAGMSDGQLAINTNLASPGLFLKNSNGDLVKVGPVHVGTTAPNVSPAAGGETGNTTGELWLDTSLTPNELKTWNGSSWVSATGQEIPVSKLIDGSARQLLQTDAAGTGVEWTSNVDVPGTLDVTSTATFDSIASHPLGSAGAPTITFTGDTNTGIYSPGADQVAVATNGTGRLFVDSSGRLQQGKDTAKGSFGENTPTYCTEIASVNPNILEIANNGTGANSYSALVLSRSDSTSVNGHTAVDNNDKIGEIAFIGADGSDRFNAAASIATFAAADYTANNCPGTLVFSTNVGGPEVTERLRITSDGKVGIGTSTPGQKLHIVASSGVNNCVRAELSGTATYQTEAGRFVNTDTGTGTAMGLYVAGTDYSVYSNNGTNFFGGNVGIGTTSPQSKASFLTTSVPASNPTWSDSWVSVGPNVGSSTGAALGLGYDSSGDEAYLVSLAPGVAFKPLIIQANIIKFQAGSSGEDARIDSSGRLLVGTSSQTNSSLLTVEGNTGNNAGAGELTLQRGELATSITAGESLGHIYFGDNSANKFAEIACWADAAAGSSDYARPPSVLHYCRRGELLRRSG
jgi:hypothetical protein